MWIWILKEFKPSTAQRPRCPRRRWTCRTPCWTSCGSHSHCCRASCRLQRRRDRPPSRSASDDGIRLGVGSGTRWSWHGSGKCKSIFTEKIDIQRVPRRNCDFEEEKFESEQYWYSGIFKGKMSILIKIFQENYFKSLQKNNNFKIINGKTLTVSKWIDPR